MFEVWELSPEEEEKLEQVRKNMANVDFALATLPPEVQAAWEEFDDLRLRATGEAETDIPGLSPQAIQEIYDWYQGEAYSPPPPSYLRLEQLIEQKHELPAGTLKEVSDLMLATFLGDEDAGEEI